MHSVLRRILAAALCLIFMAQPAFVLAASQEGSELKAVVSCADGGKLNLRKRASSSATVLDQIPTGEVLTIYEKGSKWCYTNYGGEWGYVMTSFLKFGETSAPSQNTSSSSSEKATVYCADGGKLNLRKTASSTARVLKLIPNGKEIEVLSKGSKWCKVRYAGETGHVMTKFLVFGASDTTPSQPSQTPKPTAAPESSSGIKATVYCADGGKLNLRKKASASAGVLKQIPTGTVLSIIDKGTTWCKTTYGGKEGYVMTKYLRFAGSVTPTPKPTQPETPPATQPDTPSEAPAGSALVKTQDGGKLNLRSGRGTSYKVKYQIPNLSIVTVLENYGTWTKVSFGKYTGYVMTKYLVISEAEAPSQPSEPSQPSTPSQPSAPNGSSNITGSVTGNGNGGAIPSDGSIRFGEYRFATVVTSSANGTLKLRKGPGTGYGKVTEIPNGTRIVVRAKSNGWCNVYWGDKVGYVDASYLNIDPSKGDYVDLSTKYDTAILDRTLKSGHTGEDVLLVQTRLKELNFLSSVTGTYDSATVEAVKKFQTQHSLDVDGKAGSQTFKILFGIGAFPYVANAKDYHKEVIRYNSSSSMGSAQKIATVTKAQTRLRELGYLCPIDGDFEELTHDAIVDFQLRNDLVANGFLDIPTQVMLESANAKDASYPARYYLENNAGFNEVIPTSVRLLHWADEVKALIGNGDSLTVYHPETGLSFKLKNLSQGRHWDVEPETLRDTLLMRKAFDGMSWDIQVVYVLLPNNVWCMATMHNRAHHVYNIVDNGFGGQNCVHFLRTMSEAQANDPSYGVRNQEVLRDAWKDLTGEDITY
ncbi:MAG: SH3 domain-containing protein [Clostridia bacterium]|nr:SH3 domain-containing protein [Clostridia bacterium]